MEELRLVMLSIQANNGREKENEKGQSNAIEKGK